MKIKVDMEILAHRNFSEVVVHAKKKWGHDEEVVRRRLVVVWTKILEKYANPGVPIPSTDRVYQELLKTGVDAAVDAVINEHWIVFSFMIREQIENQVSEELNRFDLNGFIEEVKAAQLDRALLHHLRETIRRHILE